MNARTLAVVVLLGAAPAAYAQPGVVPPAHRPTVPPQPTRIPPYESLVERDAAGRVVRLAGCLDALALQRNPFMDEEARQRIAPHVKEWTADVNQLAIDNVDLIERIDRGLLERWDPADPKTVKLVQQISAILGSAGSLTDRLLNARAIEPLAGQVNRQIANEYIQAVAMEISSTRPDKPNPSQAELSEQFRLNGLALNRWNLSMAMRDVRAQYRRILVDSAATLDPVLESLSLSSEDKARLASKIQAVKAAASETDRLVAVRALLDDLTFDQRRAYLAKAVELGAAPDPFTPAPEFPAAPAAPGDTGS